MHTLNNDKKDARDKARKKWLYCHQAIIRPLLPSNSNFFDNLQNEISAWHDQDAPSFVPLCTLDQQPKLVEGGTMKDYQVRSS